MDWVAATAVMTVAGTIVGALVSARGVPRSNFDSVTDGFSTLADRIADDNDRLRADLAHCSKALDACRTRLVDLLGEDDDGPP